MDKTTTGFPHLKPLLIILWICSIIAAGFIGFIYGRSSQISQTDTEKKAFSVNINQVASAPAPIATAIDIPLPSPSVTPGIVPTTEPKSKSCSKTGLAQKWEYLTTYVIKQNDSLQSIATEQLNDPTRVNEILQINGVGSLIVDSTLYLPPPTIPKSSGNLKKVSGKLIEKNSTSWLIRFSSDTNGTGYVIPAYWFEGVANIDSFKVGDCVEVFFDDGYKVFSVSLQ